MTKKESVGKATKGPKEAKVTKEKPKNALDEANAAIKAENPPTGLPDEIPSGANVTEIEAPEMVSPTSKKDDEKERVSSEKEVKLKEEEKIGPRDVILTPGCLVAYHPGFADRDVAKKNRKAVPALVTEVNGEEVCLTVFPARALPVVKEDVPFSEVGLVDVHYWNLKLD